MISWEDTVMNEKELIEIWTTGENRDPFEDFGRMAKAQAEISFKAGVGEVVEWLENSCMLSVLDKSRFIYKDVGSITFSLGNLKDSEQWQTKLKDWGIRTDKDL